MGDRGLKPRLFPRSLGEPRPDCRNVQDAQVLEQNAPTEAQGLNNKVIEKVIGRFRKVGGQKSGNVTGIVDDLRNDIDDAGRDCREQYKLDEEKGEIEGLCDDLTLTTRRRAHEDCQFPAQCRYDKLYQQSKQDSHKRT